jgi:hypothetical protein
VVDVGRDAVAFRGEGDRGAGDVNNLAVTKVERAALGGFSTSVWQELRRR